MCVCLRFHFLSLVLISTIGFDNYYNKYIPSELVDNEFSDSVCVCLSGRTGFHASAKTLG